MNTLLQNSWIDMAMTHFLVVYAALAAVGLVAGSVAIWLSDRTRDEDLPADSRGTPDPYQMAYLRSGAAGVARLAVADLLQRGCLELISAKRRFSLFASPTLQRHPDAPDLADLTPIQKAAWDWVAVPRLLSQIAHRRRGLVKSIRPLCRSFTAPLRERGLLETTVRRLVRGLVAGTLSLGIVGLGIYRLIATAIAGKGESPGLILLMIAGLAGLAIVCRPVRLSDLGQRYLESLSLDPALYSARVNSSR